MGGGKTVVKQENKIPAWIESGGQEVWNHAREQAAANPVVKYEGQLSAGTNAQLGSAASSADAAKGVGQGDLTAARSYTDRGANGTVGKVNYEAWNPEARAAYENPYLQQVQQNTLETMRRQNSIDMQGLGDEAAAAKGYGGDRHAILESELGAGQNRNILQYLAQSNSDAYNDAYNKFATDRTARMGAEGTNASLEQQSLMRLLQAGVNETNIGKTSKDMAMADVDAATKLGLIQNQIEQGALDRQYEEFLRMQDAPLQRDMQLMSMIGGAPASTSSTQTTKQSGGLFGQVLGAGMTAASVFSDRRLKRDIERLGELENGLGVYGYRYLWSPVRHIGVIADEVRRKIPSAVTRMFGFDAVDYSKLGG